MKIDPKNDLAPVNDKNIEKSKKTAKSSDFGKVLTASMEKNGSENVQHTSTSGSRFSSVTASQPVSRPTIVPFVRHQNLSREQLVNRMDNFLNLLEDYALKLEDASIDMHEIHPLVGEIKKENHELSAQLPLLDQQDHLTFILSSALQTAEAEIKSFESGYYVSIIK